MAAANSKTAKTKKTAAGTKKKTAAKTSSGKSTARKKTQTAKSSASAKKKTTIPVPQPKTPVYSFSLLKEVLVIAAFCFSIVLFVCCFQKQGDSLHWLKTGVFYLFGAASYLLPFFFFGAVCCLVFGRNRRLTGFRLASILLFVLASVVIASLAAFDGGIFGSAVARWLTPAFGTTGTYIVMFAVILIGVVMLFCARLSHTLRGNTLFNDILSAAGAAALAVTSVRLGLAADADKIIIGNVMLLIPGVELSISDMRGLHLLGYGAGERAEPLRRTLTELAEARKERAQEILARLDKLGYPLEDTLLHQQGTVGRAHIARALVEKGWLGSTQEAFDRFLAEGAPAYVPGKRLNMEQALTLLRQCGMVPVLAHPALLSVEETALPMLLQKWQSKGLMGVEVYHPAQRSRGFGGLERIARRMGLLVTGGSDFHTTSLDSHGQIGVMCASWPNAAEDAARLMRMINGDD